MNKPKVQGTTHESWIVKALEAAGLKARRIAEGGILDEGDVEFTLSGVRWVLEAKASQNLNVQETLGKARKKVPEARVAVVWKRLVRIPGKKNREPVAGERIVVILSWEDWLQMVAQIDKAGTV